MAGKSTGSRRSGAKGKSEREASRSSAEVDALLTGSDHPLKEAVAELRSIILAADPAITEGIKWNAPSYRTTEWFATVNMRERKGIAVILHFGAKKSDISNTGVAIDDPKGLLKWLAKDRAVVHFATPHDLAGKLKALQALLRAWIRHLSEGAS